MTDNLKYIGIPQIGAVGFGANVLPEQTGFRKDPLIFLGVDDPLYIAVVLAGQVSGVRGGNNRCVGVFAEDIVDFSSSQWKILKKVIDFEDE